jgi:hypothetical protein
MARIPLRPLVEYAFEHKTGTPLREFVLDRRSRGDSWSTIAEAMSEMTDGLSQITDQTVRLWFYEDDPRSPVFPSRARTHVAG